MMRSTALCALLPLLAACLHVPQDEAFPPDAALREDAAAPDASVALTPVGVPSVSTSGREAERTDRRAESRNDREAAPVVEPSDTVRAALAPQAADVASGALDAHWVRESVPESLDGVATTPYDPNVAAGPVCRGVMSEGQLCSCLTGTIDPQYADSYAATCRHEALGVPGFGLFTDRSGGSYVTQLTEGGISWLTYVDSPGFSTWGATGASLLRAGTLSVLAIELTQSGGCTNDGWDMHEVRLCAVRAPGSRDYGRCVRVRTSTVLTTWDPESDVTTESRSGASFRLTSRGTVVVRAKGRGHDRELRRQFGEHRL